jgi:hypothetical protein
MNKLLPMLNSFRCDNNIARASALVDCKKSAIIKRLIEEVMTNFALLCYAILPLIYQFKFCFKKGAPKSTSTCGNGK